jgi:Holliday junction resolvasome RuvABC DNA-binding subunit|tara:strand:+ start:229 stop:495 length:267 start_codon:yes stop_codon:yes gene_type:complete
MTNQQIEYLSQKVAELVIAALEDKQKQWDTELVQDLKDITESPEEKLLSELAGAMSALDHNLKQENYPRCAELKATILHLEQQLNKFK